jgi:hypothetical protein
MTLQVYSTYLQGGPIAHISNDAIFQDGDLWNGSAHNLGCNYDRTEIPNAFVGYSNTSHSLEVGTYRPSDCRRHFLKMATYEPEVSVNGL